MSRTKKIVRRIMKLFHKWSLVLLLTYFGDGFVLIERDPFLVALDDRFGLIGISAFPCCTRHWIHSAAARIRPLFRAPCVTPKQSQEDRHLLRELEVHIGMCASDVDFDFESHGKLARLPKIESSTHIQRRGARLSLSGKYK